MNIDERLEKLTERHEALTQTVEMIAAENRAGFTRLDKLKERHEALTQTVEMMAAENRAGFARLDKLEERHGALTQTVELLATEHRAMAAEMGAGFRRAEILVGQMAQSIDAPARVVELHEHRLDKLEGGAA